MKYATEDLLREHHAILFGLKILEEMARKAHESTKVEAGDIAELVDFLRLFADKCHHGKEETIVFPAMEKAGVRSENGPIGQMLLEHDRGRKYLSEMAASIEGGVLSGDSFAAAAESYINLLRSHIEKENKILFPLGDKMIPAEEQEQLIDRLEEFEEKVMGKGVHERLHEMLHRLSDKHLKL